MCKYKDVSELPITLTVEEIASILGISRNKAYELVNSDGFITLRLGKRIVIPKAQFINWLNSSKSIAV